MSEIERKSEKAPAKKAVKKAVMYGAGNIGRGFIGQLFWQSGYETVFIDINRTVVDLLNRDRSYPIRFLSADNGISDITVENVRAVDGRNTDEAAEEIASADIMATAVGVNVLHRIAPVLALGISKRLSGLAKGDKRSIVTPTIISPLNILICENLLDANHYLSKLVRKELPPLQQVLMDEYIGFVEASIGRMVPVMTPEMQDGNPLRVCVEEYAELPVDKDAFRGHGPIPSITGMLPFSPFLFYIRRKLYIHNLGHAVTAYLGYQKGYEYTWQAVSDAELRKAAYEAMMESARALSIEHDVPMQELTAHVEDLLYRFGNRLLGDTVGRVGGDPLRKLSPGDRLIGPATLCLKHGITPLAICHGIAAALRFDPVGDTSAQELQRKLKTEGIDAVLETVCGITNDSPLKDLKAGKTPDTLKALILAEYGRGRS